MIEKWEYHLEGLGIPPALGFLSPVDDGAFSPDLGAGSPDFGSLLSDFGAFRIDFGASVFSSAPLDSLFSDVLEEVETVRSLETELPGDCVEERDGDLIEDGVGRVLPLDLEGARGVGEEELDPGNEDVPEGRRLVLLFGTEGSSFPDTAFW